MYLKKQWKLKLAEEIYKEFKPMLPEEPVSEEWPGAATVTSVPQPTTVSGSLEPDPEASNMLKEKSGVEYGLLDDDVLVDDEGGAPTSITQKKVRAKLAPVPAAVQTENSGFFGGIGNIFSGIFRSLGSFFTGGYQPDNKATSTGAVATAPNTPPNKLCPQFMIPLPFPIHKKLQTLLLSHKVLGMHLEIFGELLYMGLKFQMTPQMKIIIIS